MITLITGGPGLGKSALAVKMLVSQYKDRPLFTNIRGLTIDHSPLPPLDEWTFEEKNAQGTSEHHFSFPPGAVVVIDECQQFFRPRAVGSKVPPYVSAFETHRHRGLDFILITQGSRLIDSNLRSLVKGGMHIFLKSSYVGRYRYEKSECINEDDKSSYSLAARRKYTLPKDVFNLYKSAELHTKPPRPKLPLAAYLILGGLGIGGVLAWNVQDRISGALNKEQPEQQHAATGPAAPVPPSSSMSTPAASVAVASVPPRMIEALTPLDDHNPLSAPLYAPVAPPVTPPQIVGCIASKRVCTCYSQQQTPVWLPEEQCRQRAAGAYYDPYRVMPQPREETKTATAAKAVAPATEVQALPASEMPAAML